MVVFEQIVIVLEGHNWGCSAINVGMLLYSLNRSIWSNFFFEKISAVLNMNEFIGKSEKNF